MVRPPRPLVPSVGELGRAGVGPAPSALLSKAGGNGGGRGATRLVPGRHLLGDDLMRRLNLLRRPAAAGRVPSGLLGALLLLPLGCAHAPETSRLQAEDETDRDRYGIKTVGDVSTVSNAQPVRLGGVGLVVGLEGTGGDVPRGDPYRSMLEAQLGKQKVERVKDLLGSPDTALVVVSAQLPPGAHKGDPIDVEVSLPPRSRATSLRGGYLKYCWLYDFEFTSKLSPGYQGP